MRGMELRGKQKEKMIHRFLDEKGIRTNKGQALTLSLSSVLHPPIRCSLVFFLPFVEAAAAQGMKH
jgi:hypothetical protein